MQKYIDQLVADLKAAENNIPPKPNVRVLYPGHPALDFGLDYIAEWECAPSEPMNNLFGIDVAIFPDASKLSAAQTQQLVDGILSLWAAFNFDTCIPEGTPIHLVYKALLDKWENDPVQYVSEGICGLEFCDYEPERCPWGLEHCTCKDFDDDMDKYKMTPEQEAEWKKGIQPGGGWINPKLLDENGNFDPTKLDDM